MVITLDNVASALEIVTEYHENYIGQCDPQTAADQIRSLPLAEIRSWDLPAGDQTMFVAVWVASPTMIAAAVAELA